MKLKPSLSTLKPYTPNPQTKAIKLDANEANYNINSYTIPSDITLNRYPDSLATSLTNKLAEKYNLSPEELIIGSGSSELLELIVKSFVSPNEVVLSLTPSFVMYEKYARYYNATFETFPLNQDGLLNTKLFLFTINQVNPKVIFLSNPNNPTGTSIKYEDIKTILHSTKALVVLDEAYIEFLNEDASMIDQINNHPNLLVTRTFSKAYGLASLRVGYLVTNKYLIKQLKRVKTPYSVSQLSLFIATNALIDLNATNQYIKMIKKNKATLKDALSKINMTPLHSDANFLYLSTSFPLASYLETYDISIRSFPNQAYRITIPSDNELPILLKALKEIKNENKNNLN